MNPYKHFPVTSPMATTSTGVRRQDTQPHLQTINIKHQQHEQPVSVPTTPHTPAINSHGQTVEDDSNGNWNDATLGIPQHSRENDRTVIRMKYNRKSAELNHEIQTVLSC